MNRKQTRYGVCAAMALAALGILLLWQIRRLQLNYDLRAAIRQDKAELVRARFAQGADPNAIDPGRASGESWRQQISRLLGRSQVSDSNTTALGVATGMSLSGDPNIDAHWNPEVISALLAHGAVINPRDRQHPWGDLKGWTLDEAGFGMTYIQHFHFAPGSNAKPTGLAHMYFEKHRGEAIIAAFRSAGLKSG